MINLMSADKNYNVSIEFSGLGVYSAMALFMPGVGVAEKIPFKEAFAKVSRLFKSRLQDNFTQKDLLMPLAFSLRAVFKRKIESLNLFYDDLPEVNEYYDQFLQELAALRYKNWGSGAEVTDPFPTLKKIEQALSNVGVVDGMQSKTFLEFFDILFYSNDLLDCTSGAFLRSEKAPVDLVPVKLSLALTLCAEYIFNLRADIEKFLRMLEGAVEVPADFPKELFFLDVPLIKSCLTQGLAQLPQEFYLFDHFPEKLHKRFSSFFDSVLKDCEFLITGTSDFLDPIEAGIQTLTNASPKVEKVDVVIRFVTYSFTLDQLVNLKNYYQQTFDLQVFFDSYIHNASWNLKKLFIAFEKWKQALPSKINFEDVLRRAASEMFPEEQEAETETWLAEMDNEKVKKQKKLQKKKAQPKGANKKAVTAKKVEPIRPPSPEKSIVKVPHPVLFALISGVQGLHTHAFAALRQAYVFESDLKLIQRKVVQSGLDNGQISALFLSTIRTSYLYLEQLFRSLKEDQAVQFVADKSHDLYSFGSKFVELNPNLIQNLFLGNFWVDYAEDHLNRWKRSGGTINRTTPALLTRSERIFKRGCKPIATNEITDLIGDVFATKSLWLKTAYSDQTLGTEDPKEREFSLTIPKLSFVQANKQLQGLLDHKIFGSYEVDQQRRTLTYLEETLKGASVSTSAAEKSYYLRTALHLMHLALEWGFEQYGNKQGLKDFKDHNLLQLAKNVGYLLSANKEKYLKRFFQLARPLSSYPYDHADRQCELIPLILKLDYKANYALHQKERPIFPKIKLNEAEAGKLMAALANGFSPLLEDVLKSLRT